VSTVYRDRDGARDFLRQQGVPIGENALKDLASRGTGPAYTIINGRALYRDPDLLEWIADQAQRNAVPARKTGRGRRRLKSERAVS
jgi:hypothetical protein